MNKSCFRLVVAILLTFFSNVARGEANQPCLYAKLSTDNVLTVCYDNNWGYYVAGSDGGYYTIYDGVETLLSYTDIMESDDNYFGTAIAGDLGRALYKILLSYDYEDVHKIVFDNSLNTLRNIPIKDASDLFRNHRKLTAIVGWENLDMSQITDISNMFNSCESLTIVDLSSFHTENVTNMNGLFAACFSLESLDLSNFNTSKVTKAVGMFGDCRSLKTIDLSNFVFNSSDPQSEYYALFENCTSLETIRMGTMRCKKIDELFYGDTALKTVEFTGPVSGFERCISLFENCKSLEALDMKLFDTSNAFYMGRMFMGCSSLKSLDLSNFHTSNALSMDGLFHGCSNIVSIYVGDGWDVKNVSSSNFMFGYCNSIVGQDGTTFNESETDISKAHYGAGGYLRYKGTQGINPTTATSPSGEGMYYTLDGRKVANPTKGVYIDKGKKVVIK